MNPMADAKKSLNARDTKLIQWLNEAYAKEAELEADLGAHIALTEKASYKKRLQQHLKETRDHKRRVASRIKQLGGGASGGLQLPGVPGSVGEVAGKAVSAVKGQVGAARAAVTCQPETHLRNAQEELREEHVEIALYARLITLAEAVGDRETAQLAKAIRRDEERMAKFLTGRTDPLGQGHCASRNPARGAGRWDATPHKLTPLDAHPDDDPKHDFGFALRVAEHLRDAAQSHAEHQFSQRHVAQWLIAQPPVKEHGLPGSSRQPRLAPPTEADHDLSWASANRGAQPAGPTPPSRSRGPWELQR